MSILWYVLINIIVYKKVRIPYDIDIIAFETGIKRREVAII